MLVPTPSQTWARVRVGYASPFLGSTSGASLATGPYEIKSYQPKSRIVLEKNPSFQAWRFHGFVPAGNADRVTWDIVPNASVALHRVLTGKDDWMSYYQIPSKRLPAIEEKHKWRLKFFTPPVRRHMMFDGLTSRWTMFIRFPSVLTRSCA